MKKNLLFLLFILFLLKIAFAENSQELILSDTDDLFLTESPNKWYNWLMKKITVRESEEISEDLSPYMSYDYYVQFEGMIVRDIFINKIDIFHDTARDSSLKVIRQIAKLSNSIHINTQDFIIRNNILFQENDVINAYNFAESERLLRKNNFIYESAIIVLPDNKNVHNKDSLFADIYIYTQDIWSIRASVSYNTSSEKGNLELTDINFLGSGGKFLLNIKKNPSYKKRFKIDTEYSFEKLFDKFGQGDIYYYSDKDYINYGLGANQYFVQPWLKHLGGINFDWVRMRTNVIENDTLSYKVPIHYNQQDFWYAYTFSFTDNIETRNLYNHLIFANRIIKTNYSHYPENYKNFFKDNMLYLGNICLLRRRFYQDSYIFAFGKIEDIPVGLKIDLTSGTEIGKIRNRQYYGGSIIFSKYFESFGYSFLNLKSGSYIYNSSWENGILEISNQGISKLWDFNNYKTRTYHAIKFSRSLNPVTKEDLLSLNDKKGLRGFETDKLLGSKRLTLNIENNIFLPYTLLGFRIAFVNFADFGLLAMQKEKLFNQKLQQGYGFALRLKNEHLVFSTLQLTFAYYPTGSDYGISDFRFFREFGSFHQFDKMNYKKPDIYKF